MIAALRKVIRQDLSVIVGHQADQGKRGIRSGGEVVSLVHFQQHTDIVNSPESHEHRANTDWLAKCRFGIDVR
jgi:hypothetical protein